jgi:hypothetical protein
MRERLLVGLADQVSALLKDGWKFREATRQVLIDERIEDDWAYYFAQIGRRLGIRRKRRSNPSPKAYKLATPRGRKPAEDDIFAGKSPAEIRQMLADSDD